MGAGTHPGVYPTWPCHPGYTCPTMPATRTAGLLCRAEQKSAMGSNRTLRNSQKPVEVSLSETICLLAAFLRPCCKNWLDPKAPGCLRLSNPLRILSVLLPLP